MMGSQSELSLECKPQSYSMLLKSFGGDFNNAIDQPITQKLEEYLNRLEEERLKIDAFKRELPLCMQLLTQAMEASKQQLQSFRSNNQETRPILEEFMPIKHQNIEGSNQKPSNNSDHKSNWMVSAQLWCQEGNNNPKTFATSEHENGFRVHNPKIDLDAKQRNGGAFLPFIKEESSNRNHSSNIRAIPNLGFDSSEREIEEKRSESENGVSGSRSDNSSKGGNGKGLDSQTTATTTNTTTTAQTHRKARRCWSPDLHRRFVNALQMLGGSQVATPKQIRELMKVDGLTNDEVKSHLQKYRLHTRRPSPSPQTTGAPPPQLVVLGGIWVPSEYATAVATAHGGATTIYTPHPTTIPPPLAPPQGHPHVSLHHHHNHHHNNHQVHVYKTTTSHMETHGSHGSDGQGGVDRSESIEDGKSESSSWKGESCDNGGEKNNKLVSLRDDGESNNGSEITLKF